MVQNDDFGFCFGGRMDVVLSLQIHHFQLSVRMSWWMLFHMAISGLVYYLCKYMTGIFFIISEHELQKPADRRRHYRRNAHRPTPLKWPSQLRFPLLLQFLSEHIGFANCLHFLHTGWLMAVDVTCCQFGCCSCANHATAPSAGGAYFQMACWERTSFSKLLL